MKKYETPTALLLDVNKKLETRIKRLREDIRLSLSFIKSGEVPKLTLGLDILEKALKDTK